MTKFDVERIIKKLVDFFEVICDGEFGSGTMEVTEEEMPIFSKLELDDEVNYDVNDEAKCEITLLLQRIMQEINEVADWGFNKSYTLEELISQEEMDALIKDGFI